MKQFFVLFTKDIENVDLAEAMRYAFDYNCILHTYHYEDEESEIRLVSKNKKYPKVWNEMHLFMLTFLEILIEPIYNLSLFCFCFSKK